MTPEQLAKREKVVAIALKIAERLPDARRRRQMKLAFRIYAALQESRAERERLWPGCQ